MRIRLKNSAADDAELTVSLETLEQCLEVLFSERDVGVEVPEVRIFRLLKGLYAGVYRADVGRSVPDACFVLANEAYEPMLLRVPPNDVIGAVRRAVADDDPLEWCHGLSHHGPYRQLDEIDLVPSCGYKHVRFVVTLHF